MGDSSLPFGIDRSLLRLDSQDPYFCLHFIMIFVRDQERSLRFYIDQLGFRLVVDQRFESGGRWIEIAPPDGNASLSLALATPDSEVCRLIGHDTRIYFITEDVNAKFKEWNSRGVRFQFPPQKPEWGGAFTRFEDVDGNSFGLAGFDELMDLARLQGYVNSGKFVGVGVSQSRSDESTPIMAVGAEPAISQRLRHQTAEGIGNFAQPEAALVGSE